jgi:hypothetical protein
MIPQQTPLLKLITAPSKRDRSTKAIDPGQVRPDEESSSTKPAALPSLGPKPLGATPVFRKWNERPSQMVIVRSDRRAAQNVWRRPVLKQRFESVRQSPAGWRIFCHEARIDSIWPYRRLAARGLVGGLGVCRPAVVARRATSRVTLRGEEANTKHAGPPNRGTERGLGGTPDARLRRMGHQWYMKRLSH